METSDNVYNNHQNYLMLFCRLNNSTKSAFASFLERILFYEYNLFKIFVLNTGRLKITPHENKSAVKMMRERLHSLFCTNCLLLASRAKTLLNVYREKSFVFLLVVST